MKYSISEFFKTVSVAILACIPAGFSASAQENCDCIVGAAGSLYNLAGNVQISGDNGLSYAENGTILGGGTQVVVGAGSATVDFGSGCDLALLGVNSELTVSQLETDQLCVRVTAQTVVQADNPPKVSPALALLPAAAIGGIVLLIDDDSLSGGDSPASN